MAVLTAQSISSLALELLRRSLVLPRTVARVPGGEFSGPNGATITVRVRQSRQSRVQETPGAPISYDAINEVSVPVTVRHLYDATRLSDTDVSLGIADFGRQVTAPQVASVALGAETELAAAMNALDSTIEVTSSSDVADAVLAAREFLTAEQCPAGGRWLAVSPEFATLLLKVDKFTRVDQSGSPSALRDAVLGRLYGLIVVESAALNPGTALAYHESGIVWASRAPAIPRGSTNAATMNEDGIALRQVFAYDVGVLSDVSAIDTFAGASVVYEDGAPGNVLSRVVKLAMPDASS